MRVIVDSKERRDFAINIVRNIRAEDCPLLVTVEPYIEGHSREQQGMWHAMIREFSKQAGYSEGALKELLKQEILGTTVVEFNGKQREITRSSQYDDNGELTDKELYSLLISETQRIAAEMGYDVG